MHPIAMRRAEPIHPNGPTTADAHPDEVAGMAAAGWEIAPPAEQADAAQGDASLGTNTASDDVPLENAAGETAPAAANADPQNQDAAATAGGSEQAAPKKTRTKKAD